MALPNPLIVPVQRAAMVDSAQRCTNEWYEFVVQLTRYLQQAGVDPLVIANIEARLSAMEEAGAAGFLLQGLLSVAVAGSPESGLVQLSLRGDESAPGNTQRYGTGPTGTKGWFAAADAFTQGDGVTLTTGPDGVTEIAHGDTSSVTDINATFSGSTVVGEISLTFDQFGHVVSRTITGRQLDHNEVNAIQGGTTGEHYHLTAAQHAAVAQALPFATAMHVASMRP